jgi:hypothetical protein
MSGELVERLVTDNSALMAYLRDQGEISFLSNMESSVPKIILLAAASDLEHQVQQIILGYYDKVTNACEFAGKFVFNKAVRFQFHTYFDWSSRSANAFFALFGERFRDKAKAAVRADDRLLQSIKDFCEVGDLRNQLVHQNYAAFVLAKTAEEVYGLYSSALYFLLRLPELLEENT